MSMASMARDIRNRFLVALVFTVPVVLWSRSGPSCSAARHPVRNRPDDWQLLLSLPVVLYASSIFFAGALARCGTARWT